MIDYETLRLIAWAVIGLLLIGFAITDGFDMGVTALLPIIGKTENDRRIMINSVAPHWDGNQVWLVTAGGGTICGLATRIRSVFFRLLRSNAFSPSRIVVAPIRV